MARMKRFISLLLVVLIMFTSMPIYAVQEKNIPNDINKHWAEKQIKWAFDKDYLSGYPDGSFKPQENMTNAEYISLIIRILNGNEKINIDNTNKQMWYSKYIAKAVEIGAIDKIENFEPNNKITRDEACRLLAFAYSVKGNIALLDKFHNKDKIVNKEAIAGLLEKSIVNGYPDNTLKPQNSITRAEIANIVYRGEEIANLKKIKIEDKKDDNITALPVKESNKSSYINSFFDNKRNDVDKENSNNKKPEVKQEESTTPNNKNNDKDNLLKKLAELIGKESEVKNSSKYKDSDQDKRTAYDNAINEGKKITNENTIEDIKKAIKNIEDSQKKS